MKNFDEYSDFHEAKLDEQLEQLEQRSHLAGDQPTLRAYVSLRALYAPTSGYEERAIERVHQRLAARVSTNGVPSHEPVPQMLLPVEEQATMPLRLPNRVNVWLHSLAALLIVGVLIGGFLTLTHLRSLGSRLPELVPTPHQTAPWHIMPTPNMLNIPSSIGAITALSDHDAWAVGIYGKTPLFLHWDGKTWKEVQAANPAQQGSLSAMAALGPDNIWAVGNTGNQILGIPSPLIEHWNGQQWSVVPSPSPGRTSTLSGIAALAPDDIWAVGSYFTGFTNRGWVEHWDGSQWSIVSTPVVGTTHYLSKIVALSPTDIWTVGSFALTDPSSNPVNYHTLIEHWNGNAWRVVGSPSPTDSSLSDISARSPTDVWAVGGFRSDDAYPSRTLLEHWDGKQWSIVRSPNPLLKVNDSLVAVEALAPNDVWASGFETGSQLLHWDGKQWQIVSAANLPKGNGERFLSFAPDPSSPGALWLVGFYTLPGSIEQMLIETNKP